MSINHQLGLVLWPTSQDPGWQNRLYLITMAEVKKTANIENHRLTLKLFPKITHNIPSHIFWQKQVHFVLLSAARLGYIFLELGRRGRAVGRRADNPERGCLMNCKTSYLMEKISVREVYTHSILQETTHSEQCQITSYQNWKGC